MTHKQNPESAEFRTREAQIASVMGVICSRREYSEVSDLLAQHFAEAEARGAAEQRRKDAEIDPDDVTYALMDSQYVAGAKFGWNCGQDDDRQSLHAMIEGCLRDRMAAGVYFSEGSRGVRNAIVSPLRSFAGSTGGTAGSEGVCDG